MSGDVSRPGITRREALKRTVVFSSALLTAGWAERLGAQAAATQFPGGGMHLLLVADTGTDKADQQAVAAQMNTFAGKLDQRLACVLYIGDNFYGPLVADRFRTEFEEMYSREHLDCPFHLVLGNHDYGPEYDSGQGAVKAQMELAYARDNPGSRWKLPAKWYVRELELGGRPLVKIVFIDSNYVEPVLTPQEKLDQQRFVAAELAQTNGAPWLWMAGHHPLFSNAVHGDNPTLIDRFGPAMNAHPVSFYFAGHDHCLQHLQVAGYKPSFVVSGAGGAPLHDVRADARGYVNKIFGFTHIHVTPEFCDVQFIDTEGRSLHAFRRNLAGEVTVTAGAAA